MSYVIATTEINTEAIENLRGMAAFIESGRLRVKSITVDIDAVTGEGRIEVIALQEVTGWRESRLAELPEEANRD